MTTTQQLLIQFEQHLPVLQRFMAEEIGNLDALGIEFGLRAPVAVDAIPTFDLGVRRSLSAQLKDRFQFASDVMVGTERWPSAEDLRILVKRRDVIRFHHSLRSSWEGSAPQRLRDDQLSVFSIGEDPFDHLTYVVWTTDGAEPELWSYFGQESVKHRDLNHFIQRQFT